MFLFFNYRFFQIKQSCVRQVPKEISHFYYSRNTVRHAVSLKCEVCARERENAKKKHAVIWDFSGVELKFFCVDEPGNGWERKRAHGCVLERKPRKEFSRDKRRAAPRRGWESTVGTFREKWLYEVGKTLVHWEEGNGKKERERERRRRSSSFLQCHRCVLIYRETVSAGNCFYNIKLLDLRQSLGCLTSES